MRISKVKGIITLLLLVLIASCNKEQEQKEETVNQLPTCKITSPTNGQEIEKGETVIITVESTDIDGDIIEVSINVDGNEIDNTTSYPYIFNWIVSSESIGTHTLKATSTDNDGGSFSNEKSVVIYEPYLFVDPRDGKTYKLVDLGSQTWFAENLNYETFNSWYYDNSSNKGDIYGRLYTWNAAMHACPNGWHLPSDNEWKSLEMQLGMSQSEADGGGYRVIDEGGKLKESGFAYWKEPNSWATNSSGFSAIPGGYRFDNDNFYGIRYNGYWWSSTEYSDSKTMIRQLTYSDGRILRNYSVREWGYSVRCIKD